MKLTELTVRSLKPPERGQRTVWEKGFGVRVSQGGTKTFLVKHEERWVTIGQYPDISLKSARQEAQRIKLGIVPKKRLETLAEARDAYLRECEAKNRPATVKQYRHFLNKVKRKKLSDVQRGDIDLSSPHAVMAWRVFFNWCMRHELAEKNPFAFQKVSWASRTRVLSDDELRRVFKYDSPPYSDYLKLMILTGQRGGQFKLFELQVDTVRFPAEIMKGRVQHELPLSGTTRALFEGLRSFNGWSRAKSRLDKAIEVHDWVHHDLRRTFSTRMAALRVPIHVTEAILAHRSGQVSGVAATYNRYNYLIEMREALESYERWLFDLVR